MFDTQVAYALLNEKISLSLSALVRELLGKELSKEETRSDWTRRPLSDSQRQYAKEDVLVLESIYEILYGQLEKVGRLDWMNEEMRSIHDRNTTMLVNGDIETPCIGLEMHGVEFGRYVPPCAFSSMARRHCASSQSTAETSFERSLVIFIGSDRFVGRHHQLVNQHGLTDRQADRFASQLKLALEEATEAEQSRLHLLLCQSG